MTDQTHAPMSRRSLFKMIGMAAGSAAMYQAMTDLGFAGESGYTGPVNLQGDPKGASVLVLGAGLAGLTAAVDRRAVARFNSDCERTDRSRPAAIRCNRRVRGRLLRREYLGK